MVFPVNLAEMLLKETKIMLDTCLSVCYGTPAVLVANINWTQLAVKETLPAARIQETMLSENIMRNAVSHMDTLPAELWRCRDMSSDQLQDSRERRSLTCSILPTNLCITRPKILKEG